MSSIPDPRSSILDLRPTLHVLNRQRATYNTVQLLRPAPCALRMLLSYYCAAPLHGSAPCALRRFSGSS